MAEPGDADRPSVPGKGAGATGVARGLRPERAEHNFHLVLSARVLMSIGRSLAGVVTPIYLALEGFDAFELSEYVMVVALASAVLSALIGTLADRVGRRPFLIAMPMLTAAAGAAFAFFPAHYLLFAMGALGSCGRGAGAGAGAVGPYQPAESAFVTDGLAPRHRNTAFGRLAFGSAAGATIGGLLALLVSPTHAHGSAATAVFRSSFLAIAFVSLAAGLLAIGLAEHQQPRTTTPGGRRHPRFPARSRWLLYRLWVTNTLNGMAIGMFGPFVTYWFFRRFGASAAEVGVLFSVINAITMASTLSAAGLARRFGLVRTVSWVRIVQALLLVPMALSPSFAFAGAVYLVRMVVQRVGLPLRQSYTLGLADVDERAAVAALSNLPSQLAMAGSPLVTGYLFEEASLSLPFEIAAALQFLNASSFWLFFRRHPPEEELAAPAEVPEAK
jgi:MFS family permease